MKLTKPLILFSLLTAPAIAAEAPEPIEYQVVVAAPLAETWAQWTTAEGLAGFFGREAIIEPEAAARRTCAFSLSSRRIDWPSPGMHPPICPMRARRWPSWR